MKRETVLLRESLASSIISDVLTFAVTAGLVLIADGRSIAWQVVTIAMFTVCEEMQLRKMPPPTGTGVLQ